MPQFWMVVINGTQVVKKAMTSRAEAEAMAERWQGSHSGNRGLLKHKDRGDYVEVKRDVQAEKEWAERVDAMKRGNPQRTVWEGPEDAMRQAGLIN